ncbi:MAG: hypothetical protein ACLUKQ_02315, partial [Peptococcaceae bacterium]
SRVGNCAGRSNRMRQIIRSKAAAVVDTGAVFCEVCLIWCGFIYGNTIMPSLFFYQTGQTIC